MRRRQLLASLCAAALAGCNAPAFGGPRETDPLPGEDDDSAWAQQGPTPANQRRAPSISVTGPTETWRIESDGPVSTPAVVDDTVYLAAGVKSDDERFYNGALLAFDRETGNERWRTVFDGLGGGYAGCPPVVYRGSVYVGDAGRHSLYAVDARTGKVRWHADLGGSVNYPVVAADGVICLARQEEVIAFDTTGEELWRYSKEGHSFLETPSIVGGTVYVGSIFFAEGVDESADDESSLVVALDLQTGDVEWEVARGENFGTVSATAETLYVAGKQTVQALDATDGSRRWQQSTEGTRFRRLALDDERVFATGGRSAVAFSRETGDVLWRFEAETYLRSHPTVTASAVIASTDNPQSGDSAVTYALDDTTGEPQWTVELNGNMGYAAAASDGTVYLPSYRTNEQGVVVGVASDDESE